MLKLKKIQSGKLARFFYDPVYDNKRQEKKLELHNGVILHINSYNSVDYGKIG